MANPPVPKFAFALGAFLALLGSYLTLNAFFNPASIVEHFDSSSEPGAQMQLMWAGRFLAMVVVLVVALASRSAALLALVMLMRLVTETTDAVAFMRAGSDTGYGSLVVAALELLALIILVRRLRAPEPAQTSSRP